jgi:hypothetical protein
VNWFQIVCSSSDRRVIPSGNGTLSIAPAKPVTAAVALFLSDRFFNGFFRKRDNARLGALVSKE